MPFASIIGKEKYRIGNVLKEISQEQTKMYNPLFVSTYTSYAIDGSLISKRYFVSTSSPQNNSTAKVKKAESAEHPWLLEINGRSVYVKFGNASGLRPGDVGVIQYEGSSIYLVID
jgi:hypothetical protein